MKKITIFLFSLFCVLSHTVNAQDDSTGVVVDSVSVQGCTDATACNYDEGATADDGSCTFAVAGYDCAGNCLIGEAVTLNLYDSWGDGWNFGATTLTIAGVDYTMASGSFVEFGLCLDLSACSTADYATTDTYSSENSWEMVDASGVVIASAGNASSEYGYCPIYGCTDSTAANYNDLAEENDGSCTYGIPGCTDATACNYDEGATANDGSCTFAVAGYDCAGNCLIGEAVTLNLYDSWGDGWNFGATTLTIAGVDYTMASGSFVEFGLCLDLSACSTADYATTDTYSSENSWEMVDASGVVIASAGNASSEYGYCPIYGCTDSTAANYNDLADENDGSCTYGIPGCTDATACNYDEGATANDGSCTFAAEGLDCAGNCLSGVLLSMEDTWGDGWNGSVLTINGVDYTIPSGSSASECVDLLACNILSWTSGSTFDGETSWTLGDLASGEDGALSANIFGDCVTGCSDSTAVNYNATADIVDDSLCEYPATCDFALSLSETDSSNTGDMGWFSFVMVADGSASVNVAANTDFPEFIEVTVYSDCDSTVASTDALAAGTYFVNVVQAVPEIGDVDYAISVDITILGCTDSGAANYDPLATDDSGLCEYIYGCTDLIALNYNPDATNDDGSCDYVYGCTDAASINYNPSATYDDGSCQYVTCLQTSALLSITTGSDASNFSISIVDINNQTLASLPDPNDENLAVLSSNTSYEFDLCLSDANSYTAVLSSDSPDGWLGGSYEISTCDGQLIASSGTLGEDLSFEAVINTCGTSYLCDGNSEYGNAFWGNDCSDGSDEVLGYCCFSGASSYVGLDLCDGVEEIAGYEGQSLEVPFAIQDCDTYVFGCTDTLAFNFDSLANAPVDSLCGYYGCTDPGYFEFDAIATDDDGSCLTMIVEGCTDTLALNFDTLANLENNTCEFEIPCEDGLTPFRIVTRDLSFYGWGSTLFTLTSTDGSVAWSGGLPTGYSTYVEDVCVAPGCYSYSVSDGGFYGTGVSWSIALTEGGDYVLEGGDDESGFISFASEESCSEDNFSFGCMDPWASNYDATATSDDGSCTYSNSLTCEQAADIQFDTEFNGQAMFNVWFSFSNDIEGALLFADINGSIYDWDFTVYSGNCDSLVAEEGSLSPGDYLVEISTSSTLNTNYSATFSLEAAVEGCMEQYASNYDSLANVAAECLYLCDDVATSLVITGGSYPGELYWEMINSESGLVEFSGGPYSSSGVVDSIPMCLPSASSYLFNAFDDYGDGWNGATYSFSSECDSVTTFIHANNGGESPMNDTSIVAGDYYLESTEVFTIVSCEDLVTGCGELAADNYNPDADIVDNSLCEYALVQGCMDTGACNYDETAEEDNGSCFYPAVGFDCEGNCLDGATALVLTLDDSYGDGWNANSLTLGGVDYSLPDADGDYTTTSNFSVWMEGPVEFDACVDLSVCQTATYNPTGAYQSENDWSLADSDGTVLASGDGSSEAYEVLFGGCAEGCMDALADNFDSTAVIDNGLCEYLGCTDADYAEFDPNANVDDGSCLTANCLAGETSVSLVVGGGSWLSEVTWKIEECDGSLLYGGAGAIDTSFCADWPENYQINMIDSAEDGWNGNTLTLNGVVYGSEFTSGASDLAVIGDCGYGCTDPSADNYDDSASIEDGSCTYPCLGTSVTLTLMDSYGDGGGSVTIDSINYELPAGFGNSEASFDVCVDLTLCNPVDYVATDLYPSESSWTISLGDSIIAEGGGAGLGSLTSSVGNCIVGCTDPEAENYNPDANSDSGDCTFACDADETAVSIIMMDSFGDGWSGNAVAIASSGDTSSFTLLGGAIEIVTGCVNMNECSSIYPVPGSYSGEVSWTISDDSGELLASWDGGSGSQLTDTTYVGDCYFPGCTDETAFNYDPVATDDDGSCIAVVEGCTNEAYTEYNPDANVDDGSCITLPCEGAVLTFILSESYGDGGSGFLSLNGDTIINGVPYAGGSGNPSSVMAEVCGDLSVCNTVSFESTESWVNELSWTVISGDDTLASGSGYSSFTDVLDEASIGAGCAVPGCTDQAADNYNPEATEDDNSCTYTIYGCIDEDADNYNANANTDDGSCYYSCPDGQGQIDILVTTDTYSGSENSFTLVGDDGSSETVNLSYDAQISTVTNTYCVDNGTSWEFVLSDSYGDGILNGGYEIYVCQQSLTGFVPMTSSSEVSEVFTVVCGEIYGCMDASALNYDADATVDTDPSSCEYPCPGIDATVTISTGTYASETSWVLVDAAVDTIAGGSGYANYGVYPTDLCLVEGASYQMVMIDSYGDGWNAGGSFTIVAACDTLATGDLPDGFEGTVDFVAECGDVVDPGCPAPADWSVIVTGSNHTIMIPAGVLPEMAEGTTLEHANVGVFYTNDNGDLVCAGSAEIAPDETVQIAAMGDDTTTPEVDGLVAGEALVWMIADCNGNVFAAQATYSQGPEVFTTNGLTFVASISEVLPGPSSQLIDMPSGWSMFSTYMIADDMDMASVLSPIFDQVIIAKNNSGAAYLVEWDFNGVGDLLVGQGYQIKLTEAVQLEVSGAYAFPEDHAVDIAAGWNMIGYLRTEPAAADAVLADMNASGNLIIAKDYNGAAYLPEWNFNGIGDMYPGQGYQLKVNSADVLQYLSNDDSYRMSAVEVTENNVSHFAKAQVTDNNMTVVIEDAAWDVLPTEGAEIAAFDKDGNLVGSAIYSSPVTVLTVWGDDATSTSKDGMLVSESVSFKVWNTNEVRDFTVAKWIEGSSSYQVDGISVASTIETNNVMAELNASERVLVKVINVLGQEVNLDDEPFKGTVLFNVYDDGSVEQFVR